MDDAFNRYISKHYDNIKQKCEIAYHRATGEAFDPDIFHDTLIKCADKIGTMNDVEIDNYIYISFRTNMMREKQYARNKFKLDCEIPDIPISPKFDVINDINKLRASVDNKFGINTFEELCEWVIDKKNIHEIEKAFNEKGLYYKLRKVKKWIKEMYSISS